MVNLIHIELPNVCLCKHSSFMQTLTRTDRSPLISSYAPMAKARIVQGTQRHPPISSRTASCSGAVHSTGLLYGKASSTRSLTSNQQLAFFFSSSCTRHTRNHGFLDVTHWHGILLRKVVALARSRPLVKDCDSCGKHSIAGGSIHHRAGTLRILRTRSKMPSVKRRSWMLREGRCSDHS